MILYIKNMVCDRCKMAVINELEKQNIVFQSVELGEVILKEQPTKSALDAFNVGVEKLGFELIDDKKSKIIGLHSLLVSIRLSLTGQPLF